MTLICSRCRRQYVGYWFGLRELIGSDYDEIYAYMDVDVG